LTGNTHLLGLTSKYITNTFNDKFIYDFSLYCKFRCADGELWNKDSETCEQKCSDGCIKCTSLT